MLGRRSCHPHLVSLDQNLERVLGKVRSSKNSAESSHTNSQMAEKENEEETPPGTPPPPPPPLRPLKEHYTPSEYASPSCIQLPTVQATHYEIKPSTINLLPSFYGLNNGDPYNHIDDFLVVYSTVRINNFSREALKMFLFPFSLKDKAKY